LNLRTTHHPELHSGGKRHLLPQADMHLRHPRPRKALWKFAWLLGLIAMPLFAATIDSRLADSLQSGSEQEFFVILDAANVDAAAHGADQRVRAKRTAAVRDALLDHAARTQAPLRAWLDRRGIAYRSFHIVNALLVRGDERLARTLARRGDVLRIEGNPRVFVPRPTPAEQHDLAKKAIAAVESGISATGAPALWAQGFTGQGIVIGGQDTGVFWKHAALKAHYRGWNGSSADHNYNWHDSIRAPLIPGGMGNPCGYNAAEPCDDEGHGTHTIGTAVGDDGGGNQIGMAPGARWIACRNMDQGWGSPSSYLECFEWFLAPYPLGGTTAQGDPARAPHVTINSWGCPTAEGCTFQTLQQAVDAQRAAGIMTVVAAGNTGPNCNTIDDPPGIYDASYTVAAYSVASDALAAFSSRGLVSVDGSSRQKPDITAPGVNIRSSIPSGYGTYNGTSMATPHVAGAIALLWSAIPQLKGNIVATENALNAGARPVPLVTTVCGSTGHPNALWGYGTLDVSHAYAVASALLSVAKQGSGSGTVTSAPTGIACGATCSAQFTPLSSVSLMAEADPGFIFTGWLGACTGNAGCTVHITGARSVSATFAPASLAPLSIDIDRNADYDALTDGLMIVRFLFGLGAAMVADGTIGADATLTDPAQLLVRLQDLRPALDVDANGQADALTDGIILIRYLFGIRGPALTMDALGTGATRDDPTVIGNYIAALMP
jgi:subtilisin family serine protease